MKRIGFVCLWICIGQNPGSVVLAQLDPRVVGREAERVAVIERVSVSVVAIFTPRGDGGGSGVLISPDGYALSNFHVTSGAGPFMKCGLNDGRLYDAVIVGIDPVGDVSLIKLLGRSDFPAAVLGDSDNLQVGETVYALGNPFLLATDFQPTLTMGIVCGLHRYQYPAGTILEYTDCIQTDASINPGNSGGPLFNERGELVGINGRGSFEKRGRVNVGAGYAISINQIRNFLDQLRAGRIVDHASLGATVRSTVDRHVVVERVREGSSAARRGLQPGDEVLAFAGRPIGSANQLKNVLGIFPDGWKVPLVYRRDGQRTQIMIELDPLHTPEELQTALSRFQPPQPDAPRPRGAPPQDRDRPIPELPSAELHPPTESIPDAWKHLYESRPGFANYYFNRLEQQRFSEMIQQWGNYASSRGIWRWSGRTHQGEAFEFTLAEPGFFLRLDPQAVYHQPRNEEPVDEPPGTGGLLTAVAAFQQLLVSGPQSFSVFYYLGSEPLDGRGPLVDVYVTQQGSVYIKWFVDRLTQSLVGCDSYLSRQQDPCEIRFSRWEIVEGKRFPREWMVRNAERLFATFHIAQIQLQGPRTP